MMKSKTQNLDAAGRRAVALAAAAALAGLAVAASKPALDASAKGDPVEALSDDAGAKAAAGAKAKGWTAADCIDGRCDRDVPVYGPGEEMTFTFRLRGFAGLDAAKCTFAWARTGDDGRKEKGAAPADRPLVLKTSLDRPGFVRYLVELKDAAGKVVKRSSPGEKDVFFDGGAGVEIFKIRPGVAEPDDFDAFWARHRETLAKVEWKGREKVVPVASDNPALEAFAVEVPCAGGMPATGFLYVPVAAKEGKKFPAQITFWGYGASWSAGATKPSAAKQNAKAVTFACSAHGFELMRETGYYRDLRKKVSVNGGYAFDPKTNADPETAYFCGMSYRVMRALEFLKSRPEWNGRDLAAKGGSMGGLQSIWAAALDPDVTLAEPGIPWCCDIGGETVGRNRGSWYVKWVAGLGYYDPVNMAPRIRTSCRVAIPRFGLGDYICPPTGVMAFYNRLKCPKTARGVQNSTHGYVMPKPRQEFNIVGESL